MEIAICFGTRPEIIKLSMLSQALSKHFEVINVFSGQHSSLFEDVKHLMPDIQEQFLYEPSKNLSQTYSSLLGNFQKCFEKISPDLVIVQGDTATAFCAAFCAFLNGIKIGHVEAGLRTNRINSPFPEEFNRQMIDKISTYNWCPTEDAARNLINGNGLVYVTGNTIVDLIYQICKPEDITYNNEIVITLHRRENKDVFRNILIQINEVANLHPELRFIFPVHPNPIIQDQLSVITASNIDIKEPMKYECFIELLQKCRGIITDSGGIQEEAVCLRKKALVCRHNTERQEGVTIGLCKLVGGNVRDNFEWLLVPFEGNYDNPYGNGDACVKIINSILYNSKKGCHAQHS
jgi:UDP-N-acetylglucosamine 2-epimerase (non-hydrolysing)